MSMFKPKYIIVCLHTDFHGNHYIKTNRNITEFFYTIDAIKWCSNKLCSYKGYFGTCVWFIDLFIYS